VIISLYQLTLTLDTPGAVSAPESRAADSAGDAALPVARDHEGRPAVPATSLAGSLRAHAAAREVDVLFLFGGTRKEPDPEDPRRERTVPVASPVRFLGTRTELPRSAPKTLHRTRNAIDRRRAAPATNALFTRELLPPGTEITVWLRLDADPVAPGTPAEERTEAHERADRAAKKRAETLERILATWRPVVGGSRGTGNGRGRLTAVRRRTLDLTDPADRRRWLLKGGPGLFDDADDITRDVLGDRAVEREAAEREAAEGTGGAATERAGKDTHAAQAGTEGPLLLGRVLAFDVVDALHIGTGRTAEETETAGDGRRGTKRLLLHRDHAGRPVVPGSTWKGLLRTQCEFILRSLGEDACAPLSLRTARAADTDGATSAAGADGATGAAETPNAAGCDTCRVCRAFGHTGRRGRLVFLDSPLLAPDTTGSGSPGPAQVTSRNHVALDRVTSGAADGALYTHEVVEEARVELRILDEPPSPADASPPDPLLLDVLHLALYDLHTGALGVGHATTRGYGTLRGAENDGGATGPSRASTAQYLEAAAHEARARVGQTLFSPSSEAVV
jgi:CRISPR/Cas system CSM-associated protein Csm3 (group 7 of RAMP superfamily)